ncbi:hypothetical protein NQZ68_024497 [Dissostichus eleginoides]|nr:hypothetical protein NQZ68_024497 [Dissostichus eleginoides]
MERDIDTAAGTLANTTGGPGASVRGMKRGDPEPDAQTAAALTDLPGAECKRPRIDGTTVVDIGQGPWYNAQLGMDADDGERLQPASKDDVTMSSVARGGISLPISRIDRWVSGGQGGNMRGRIVQGDGGES